MTSKQKNAKGKAAGLSRVVFIRISEKLDARLRALAEADHRELAPFCRLVLQEYAESPSKNAPK